MRRAVSPFVLAVVLSVAAAAMPALSIQADGAGCKHGWSSVAGPGFGQTVSEQAKAYDGLGGVMQDLMRYLGCGSGSH